MLEELRQEAVFDEDFVKNELYFFELTIPAVASYTGSANINAVLPLLINPQAITMSEPYAVTPTATVGGGLYVEEDGVIARQLRITGTTGFEPRSFAGTGVGAEFMHLSADLEHTVPLRNTTGAAMATYGPSMFMGQSGQRQFQYLQDRIFRVYSDLKQNAEAAAGTRLAFHNPKDDEHWEVVPLNFTMTRAAPRATMYFYDIQLLVVGPAAAKSVSVMQRPDQMIVGAIKNGIAAVRKAVAMVEGAIRTAKGYVNAVNEIVGDIKGAIKSVNNLFTALDGLIESVTNLVSGVVSIPGDIVGVATQAMDTCDKVLTAVENWGGARPGVYNVMYSYREMQRALTRLKISGEQFDAGFSAPKKMEQLTNNINPTQAQADFSSGASGLQQAMSQGTGFVPGDAQLDRGDPKNPNPGGSVSSPDVREMIVMMNDSMEAIAGRLFGDPGRASELIAINNLRPPYISTTGIPGTLAPGDIVLIPSPSTNPVGRFGPSTYGASMSEPLRARLFATDFRINPLTTPDKYGLYDLVIDSTGEDVRLVAGVPNLEQGVRTRILTELGSDPLYPQLGYRRFVGLNSRGYEQSLVRLSLKDTIEDDGRITSVHNMKIRQTTPDHLDVEFDANVISIQDRLQMQIVR